MVKFLKTTIIGGLVLLLPAVLASLVLGKALSAARAVAAPLSGKLPHIALFGLGTVSLVAILLLLLACFLTGLLREPRWDGENEIMVGPLHRFDCSGLSDTQEHGRGDGGD